jgi:hypothetical protein
VLSLILTFVALAVFWCADGWGLYLVALYCLFWLLAALFPGVNAPWGGKVLYFVYVVIILIAVVILLQIKSKIRAILLEWIIAAIACAIILYFVDYVEGADLGVFTGPAIDMFGPEDYPGQLLQHIIIMTVLYVVNRILAMSAALAVGCYSRDPTACCYRCRNSCCCCCCETDFPDERELRVQGRDRRRRRETVQQEQRTAADQVFDYDYGATDADDGEEEGNGRELVPGAEDGDGEDLENQTPQIEGQPDADRDGGTSTSDR